MYTLQCQFMTPFTTSKQNLSCPWKALKVCHPSCLLTKEQFAPTDNFKITAKYKELKRTVSCFLM